MMGTVEGDVRDQLFITGGQGGVMVGRHDGEQWREM